MQAIQMKIIILYGQQSAVSYKIICANCAMCDIILSKEVIMANIVYKTTEKPAVQRAILKAISWIGVRQTSYSELAREAKCQSSDARYAILDLLEKGYVERIQTKGYANATRGFRYAYKVTESGEKWLETPMPKEPPKEEPIVPGLFV